MCLAFSISRKIGIINWSFKFLSIFQKSALAFHVKSEYATEVALEPHDYFTPMLRRCMYAN